MNKIHVLDKNLAISIKAIFLNTILLTQLYFHFGIYPTYTQTPIAKKHEKDYVLHHCLHFWKIRVELTIPQESRAGTWGSDARPQLTCCVSLTYYLIFLSLGPKTGGNNGAT